MDNFDILDNYDEEKEQDDLISIPLSIQEQISQNKDMKENDENIIENEDNKESENISGSKDNKIEDENIKENDNGDIKEDEKILENDDNK